MACGRSILGTITDYSPLDKKYFHHEGTKYTKSKEVPVVALPPLAFFLLFLSHAKARNDSFPLSSFVLFVPFVVKYPVAANGYS
jgi:hypothetical protein